MRNNKNSTSPNCSKERTEQNVLKNKSTPKEKLSINSIFQQSLLNYEKHLGYFCKYINKIHKDEFTDLTDLLEKIKTLDFSFAKRTSQLRPLAQLLNVLQMLTDIAFDQEHSFVHAKEEFNRSDERDETDDWEIERTQPSPKRSAENTSIRFVEFNK